MDGLTEGVGASQVLAYAERIAQRNVAITLHTFESASPSSELVRRVRDAGIDWHPHAFGRPGAVGGLQRIARCAAWARTGDVVHARSDLAAAAALVARTPRWVWDIRSLWADQRIALGMLQEGSREERVLRRIETSAARRSTAVITLTSAVLPVLDARHGLMSTKASVIPTCVDTTRFQPTALPPEEPLMLLLAGTLNRYYDVPAMAALVRELRRRRRTTLTVLTPRETPWDALLTDLDAVRETARPADMPAAVGSSHVGLSVCREDAGISLTAAMPTKIAEFLASGRPVVVNEHLGDAGALLREHRAGVVLGTGADGVRRAADELERLVSDAETPTRCRQLAEAHFDLDHAVDQLVEVYRRVAEG
jgi:glycosyltransferase involved in cell wall biosynthesis